MRRIHVTYSIVLGHDGASFACRCFRETTYVCLRKYIRFLEYVVLRSRTMVRLHSQFRGYLFNGMLGMTLGLTSRKMLMRFHRIQQTCREINRPDVSIRSVTVLPVQKGFQEPVSTSPRSVPSHGAFSPSLYFQVRRKTLSTLPFPTLPNELAPHMAPRCFGIRHVIARKGLFPPYLSICNDIGRCAFPKRTVSKDERWE